VVKRVNRCKQALALIDAGCECNRDVTPTVDPTAQMRPYSSIIQVRSGTSSVVSARQQNDRLNKQCQPEDGNSGGLLLVGGLAINYLLERYDVFKVWENSRYPISWTDVFYPSLCVFLSLTGIVLGVRGSIYPLPNRRLLPRASALNNGNSFVGRLRLSPRKQRGCHENGAQNTMHSVHIRTIIRAKADLKSLDTNGRIVEFKKGNPGLWRGASNTSAENKRRGGFMSRLRMWQVWMATAVHGMFAR